MYVAERPELFPKAAPGRARGPAEPVGIRVDSTWDVPEPELVLVANAGGGLVAYTIGNDVSSRSIEGENPLYLPQAKVFTGSCAGGPGLVPVADVPPLSELSIRLEIQRAGEGIFRDEVSLSALRRSPSELLGWLFQAMESPTGVALFTGASIVPPLELTLADGDIVTITVPGVGTLANSVQVVGTTRPRIPQEVTR